MGSRSAELIAKLVDEVSGPARGVANALKGVQAAGRDMGRGIASPALDKLTRSLKDAQRQAEILAQLQNRMKSFGEARGAFSGARLNVERLSQELDVAKRKLAEFDGVKSFARGGPIAREVEAARKAVRDLEREQARARVAVRSAAREMDAEKTTVTALRRALTDAGVPTTTLATAQAHLASKVQRATRAVEEQAAVERKLQHQRASDEVTNRADTRRRERRERRGAGALADRVSLAGAPARMLAPLAGAFGAYEAAGAYKRAASFDRRLTMIGQTADASRGEIDGMGVSVHALAQQTATPVDKLVGGLEALVAQGRNLRESMDFLPSVARTASATGSEVEDIAKTADSVGSNFKIAGRQMQSAFDIMAAGGKAGQFELRDMARYLPSLGPATAAIGFKGEKGLADLVAMLQVMRRGSGTAEEAVASMTNILNKMESDKTLKGFKDLGVDAEAAFKKARNEGRNLVEVFEELLQQATKGDASKLGEIIDDQEFKRGGLALMSFRGEWQKLSAALQGTSSGTVLRDLVQVTKDSQAGVDRLGNSWQRFTQAAARGADTLGASDRLQLMAGGIEKVSLALERLNAAYNKGGLKGVADLGGKTYGEAKDALDQELKKVRIADEEKNRETQLERIRLKEAELARVESVVDAGGPFADRAKQRARFLRGDLAELQAGLKTVVAARDAARAEPKPLRMGVDPTAPLQGDPRAIMPGPKSFLDAYPLDLYRRKPFPALPPRRPAGLPRTIDRIEDVLAPAPAPEAPAAAPLDAAGMARETEALARYRAEASRLQTEIDMLSGLTGPDGKALAAPLEARKSELDRLATEAQLKVDRSQPTPPVDAAAQAIPPREPGTRKVPLSRVDAPMSTPPVDAAAIQQATSALATYKSELAGIEQQLVGLRASGEAAFSPDASGLESRKAELESVISGVQAKIQALNAQTIAPRADGSGLAPLGTAADQARTSLSSLGSMSVAPSVDASSITTANALVLQLLGNLGRVGSAASSAKAQVAGLASSAAEAASSVSSAGRAVRGAPAQPAPAPAAAASANVGEVPRTGKVTQTMANAFHDRG